MEEGEKESIFRGDRIKTLDSTATIHWPDGSITRLGERSSIRINEMQAKTANEDIRIDFSLEQGKTWSNVIKYLYGDSYFHERFNNDTSLAAVRGTVFEVNLDRKYIHTIDHAISVEDLGTHTGSIFIVAGGVLDTDTRNALAQEKLDEVWNTLNNDADIIYLNERMESLKKEILGKFGSENRMDSFLRKIGLKETDLTMRALITDNTADWKLFEEAMKQGGNSGKLMDIYQAFYGLQNTEDVLNKKMKLRDIIIETVPENEKKDFLDDFSRSTLYDSWNTKKIGGEKVKQLEKKLEEYIQRGANQELIDTLKNAANHEGVQKLNNILESTKQTIRETLTERNLLEEAKKEINRENVEKINNTTTEIRSGITDWFRKLLSD